ncbi:MAG: DNA gyrase subunit A [Planctomycetota bacterium]|jgi:DNA gyrase subunit A
MTEESLSSSPSRIGVKDVRIEDELKMSYLTYSMSVIVSRALPDVRDGLKPVHRRVLQSMRDLNLTHRTKYRKSAKIVGECMGNYHPHGDAAIYDTIVRMAQPWSLRGMLVDGQGNWGSVDGDPAAAMRYTEARMTRLAEEMLEDIDKDTVDFQPTYDDSSTEPTVLPAKFPALLVNGATGIAVGMSTNMAPHNMTEVCKALIALCDNPDVTIKDLMKIVTGPDFPTGGQICGYEGIREAYMTGRGRVRMRSRCHIETMKKDKQRIVVTEIPYQITKQRIVDSIAGLVKNEKIHGISAIRDYSGRDGINLTIELKRGEDANVILNQLYKLSPLQDTFGIINIALVNGQPRTLNLKEILEAYRDHRFEVIRRRTLFLLNKALARAHILEGLLKAIDHIDEVIKIIRSSQDVAEAKGRLKERFELDDIQSQAILDMPLRRLTGLEREALQNEYDELQKQIAQYRAILADKELVYDIIREDAHEMIDRYGDERRTQIIASTEDLTIEDLIAEEEMAVTISHRGYIKRMSVDTYRKQGRGGKGVAGAKTADDDFTEHFFIASTHDYILFFTNSGQVYWLKVYDIPEMGRTAKGRALVNVLQLGKGEKITSMIPVREFDDSRFLVMATRSGTIKKTVLSAFGRPMKGGIRAINLDEGESLIGVVLTNGEQNLMLATRKGRAAHFKETDVRPMGRPARGVGGIKLRDDDEVVSLLASTPNTSVLTVAETGMGKRTAFDDYRLTKRGAQGVTNMKLTDKTGDVVGVMAVADDDDVMLMTVGGMVVRTGVHAIRVIGRATQGVKVIRLKDDDKVIGLAKVVGPKEEGEDNTDALVQEGEEAVEAPEPDEGSASQPEGGE